MVFVVAANQLTCQADGIVVTCPPLVCPGSHVTLTCTVDQAVGSNIWKLPTNSCYSNTPQDTIVITQSARACNNLTKQCGPFTAQNVAAGSTPCLTSFLTVVATMATSTISCGFIDSSGHETIINIINIVIIGKPLA